MKKLKKVFIDGSAGTTGLRIVERLEGRDDIEFIRLPEKYRKSEIHRKEALNNSDAVFLCLPDKAAIEAVTMIENPHTVVIDASTAHRTNEGWTYGYPELSKDIEDKIRKSKRISNPGCHASGFTALVYPLIEMGLLDKTARLTCHSITGFSGGGRTMIEEYGTQVRSTHLDSPRQYGIGQEHKHLVEMQSISGLVTPPVFCPIVSDFYSGMLVTVPIFKEDLAKKASLADIRQVYKYKYTGPVVKYVEDASEGGFISANRLEGKDSMQVMVEGNNDRMLLMARYDNLGKGASGAAIQSLNLVFGTDIAYGLTL
ncbi:MAG TPA: N-acetyl-gamma-glutamyl-phosphate reductase [Bacillota bacterium]|nr:N-acetyl-gamma-glutamyl-phosphate reductase [Bacillota bacterium]